MEPIFNFFAQTVGWLEGEIAFGSDGRPVAFIHGGAVFVAKNGHYLGRFDDGVFRDRLGCIVAFLQRTRWFSCLTTSPGTPTVPSIQSRAVPGRAHLPADPPHRAEPLLNDSSLSWDRFVTGYEAQWPWETRC